MAKNKENLEIKDLKTRYLKNENPGRIIPLSPQCNRHKSLIIKNL